MTDRQRRALDRAVEEAQERSRRNWNRMIREDEAEYAQAQQEAEQRRQTFHIVD